MACISYDQYTSSKCCMSRSYVRRGCRCREREEKSEGRRVRAEQCEERSAGEVSKEGEQGGV